MTPSLAVYLRLSLEDVDLKSNAAKDESNSISSQRGLIHRFLDQHPDLANLPRREFCDDGFSGTNFERPAFQELLQLAERGEISTIVVKDLSRFGRDYLEVGGYLEQVFPALGIRFLSVNDRYDSSSYQGKTIGMDIAFRNLVYDLYSKDLSAKVRTAMRLKQDKGQYVTSVPYGYRRSPTQKHKMEIDEPAAAIVREIFSGILSGKRTAEIAAELNRRQVPSPQVYKGIKRTDAAIPQWTHSRIVSIVRNLKYAGVMTNHTRESPHIRSRSQRRLPPSEWVVVEDAHEAIIPRGEWEEANAMLRRGSKKPGSGTSSADRVYYCAHCGRKLQKTYGRDEYYVCPSASYHQDSPCQEIHLQRSETEPLLLAALRAQVSFLPKPPGRPRKTVSNQEGKLTASLKQVERDLAQLQRDKLAQYESYRQGTCSREDFLRCKEQLSCRTQELEEERARLEHTQETLQAAQQHLEEKTNQRTQAEDLLAQAERGLRERLYDAIQRVVVTDNQALEIQWTFPEFFSGEANPPKKTAALF